MYIDSICVQCKQRKAAKNRIRCKICLQVDRDYRKAKREMEKEKQAKNIKPIFTNFANL